MRILLIRLRRSVAIGIGVLVVGSACASAGPTPNSETGELSLIDLHVLEQEAIDGCMKRSGFDYRHAAYTDQDWEPHPSQIIAIPRHDTRAYGTLFGLVQGYAPYGLPRNEDVTSQESFRAYAVALYGPRSEDSDHLGPLGGCALEGIDARVSANAGAALSSSNSRERRELYEQVDDLLRAEADYQSFVQQWSRCMTEAGFTPVTSDPDAHAVTTGFMARAEFAAALDELYATEGSSGLLHQTAKIAVLDDDWVLQIAASSPTLNRLHEQQLAQAVVDNACREEHRELIDDEIEVIFDQVFGS